MEYRLKEIGTIITGGTPKTKNAEYYSKKDYLFIGPTDIKECKYVRKSEKYISNEAYKDYKKKFIGKNSIMIDCIGSDMGNVAISVTDVLTNQQINSITNIDEKKFNVEYIYYILSTMKKYFHQIGTNGSTMPIINKTMFEDIIIDIPNKETQDKIASILSKLDQKIELNNQINNNLQKLILSIFNKFLEDNQDYNETTIKDAVKKIGTGADAIQRAPIVEYDTGIRCIRVGDMTNSRTKYQWGFTKMTEKDFENYRLSIGDIVVTRTAVNGLSYLIEEDMNVVCNNGLIRMSVNNKYNPLYIYLCLQTKDFYDYVHRIDGETSVRPNMKVEFFTSYKMMEIPIDKQNEICKQLLPLRKKQQSIIIENEKLSNLRDILLPKLMNGEINFESIEV